MGRIRNGTVKRKAPYDNINNNTRPTTRRRSHGPRKRIERGTRARGDITSSLYLIKKSIRHIILSRYRSKISTSASRSKSGSGRDGFHREPRRVRDQRSRDILRRVPQRVRRSRVLCTRTFSCSRRPDRKRYNSIAARATHSCVRFRYHTARCVRVCVFVRTYNIGKGLASSPRKTSYRLDDGVELKN